MADFNVILGGIVFQDFEVPARINFGGEQRLARHELIGGGRVIDTLGPREDDIRWEGRFRALGAVQRAQALDAMRASGAQVPLIWGGLYRTVVVEHFDANFEKLYEIPYRIACCVVQNGMQGTLGALSATLDNLVSTDLSAITGML